MEIACSVNTELIQTLMNTEKSDYLANSVIELKEPLLITHSDNSNQVVFLLIFCDLKFSGIKRTNSQLQAVELTLKILLPSIKLSSYTLNFGSVYLGDVKKLVLVVENLSACKQRFKINPKFKNSDFTLDHTNGECSARSTLGCAVAITISFEPK